MTDSYTFHVLLFVIPVGWLAISIALAVFAYRNKSGYFLPMGFFMLPFILTPILGSSFDRGTSSGWGPPGVVAAPLLFFGGPLWSVIGIKKLERQRKFEREYEKIVADPGRIWSEKYYLNHAGSIEWSALMRYWKQYPPDLNEEQLRILIHSGHTGYLSNPKLSGTFLEGYYTDWISKYSKFSLANSLLENPNCPEHILLEVSENTDFGYEAMRLAEKMLKSRNINHVVQPMR